MRANDVTSQGVGSCEMMSSDEVDVGEGQRECRRMFRGEGGLISPKFAHARSWKMMNLRAIAWKSREVSQLVGAVSCVKIW